MDYKGIQFSVVSKLDGILSWSLNAGHPRLVKDGSCPWAIDPKTGEMDMVCQDCYAQTGNYRYGNVKAPRSINKAAWQRPSFVNDFVDALKGQPFFRWFDSGDVYSPALAAKIFEIVARTPWCRHWLPTRAYRSPQIKAILTKMMKSCKNVMVRYSSPSLVGEYQQGLHSSVVIPAPTKKVPAGVFVCPAWDNEKVQCNGCRACWSRAVPVIAYIAHGRVCLSHLRKAGYGVFHEPKPPKKALPAESRRHYLAADGRTAGGRRRYPWK